MRRWVAGGWTIGALEARGSSVDVHQATHEVLGTGYVVHIIHVPSASLDELSEAERRSVQDAVALRHPNIVESLTPVFASEERSIILPVRRVIAPGWRALRSSGRLPPDLARQVARQLAEAVDHAHREGVVHGRLSPSVLALDLDAPRVHLSGFGIAGRAFEPEPEDLAFWAPEVLRGEVADVRSDIFSLAALVGPLLVPDAPALASSGETEDVLASHRALARHLSARRGLGVWLAQALDPEPDLRPGDVSELLSLAATGPERRASRTQSASRVRQAGLPTKPVTALALAAVMGLALGWLSKRREVEDVEVVTLKPDAPKVEWARGGGDFRAVAVDAGGVRDAGASAGDGDAPAASPGGASLETD